jgi:hypothetical protein
MLKKNFITIFLLLSLSACEYQPIFSTKDSDFSILKIEIQENNKIDLIIKKNLKIYENQKNKKYFYDLKVRSKKSKNILSKDSKGDPKILSMKISVYLDIIENGDIKNKKEFSESFTYNNSSNKFDLNKYEKQVEKNLIDQIIEKIIIHLYSI